MKWTRAPLVALLLAGGCGGGSGGAGSTATADLAAQDGRASGATDDGARARPADIPDPSAGGPVTLEDLQAWAEDHAPDMRVARAGLSRARAARAAADPLLPSNPELGGGAGPRFTPDGTGLDVEASLTQSFEIAGERGLRGELADRVEEHARADLAATRWRVRAELRRAYLEALVERDRLAAAERVLELQQRLLDIAERRVSTGAASPLAQRLAEGEVARARERRVAAAQGWMRARLALARIAGWPAAHPPELADRAPATLDVTAPSLERVLAAHPRVASLRARVAEARARLRLAGREAWPEPALGARWHREGGPNATEDVIVGTLTLPVPLWQRNQAARGEARAELEMAEAELDAAVEQLRTRLAEAVSEARATAERVSIYAEEVVPRFEQSLEMLERAYEVGEIDALELSLASERMLRIQNEALDARADHARALGRLEALSGR